MALNVAPLITFQHCFLTLPRAVNIFIPCLTSFCLIACFIDPFSYHAPIIKSLSDGIGNDLYNCRFVIWLWWDVRLSGNKRRSGFSMRSTSPSIRESIDFSGCPSFMRIASTSQEVLSLQKREQTD